MTATSLLEVQTAVVAKLKGNAPFVAMVSYIGEEPPEAAAFPYVIIGESTMNRFDTFTKSGNQNTLTIHIWSQALGFAECFNILNAMNVLLDYQSLSGMTANNLVMFRLENVNTLRDIATRHLVARYAYWTQPA